MSREVSFSNTHISQPIVHDNSNYRCMRRRLACLLRYRRTVMYTPVQGNREHGSVEINKETAVLTGHNCELRTAKLT